MGASGLVDHAGLPATLMVRFRESAGRIVDRSVERPGRTAGRDDADAQLERISPPIYGKPGC
jgi:hypothetical protein